jgi:hypothetical protein
MVTTGAFIMILVFVVFTVYTLSQGRAARRSEFSWTMAEWNAERGCCHRHGGP